MGTNFDACLEAGKEWEDKVIKLFNGNRLEIKHDILQQETGHLFFEVLNNDEMTPSGIDSPDWEVWLHGMGITPFGGLWASRRTLRKVIKDYLLDHENQLKRGHEGSWGVCISEKEMIELLRIADFRLLTYDRQPEKESF